MSYYRATDKKKKKNKLKKKKKKKKNRLNFVQNVFRLKIFSHLCQ